MKRLTMLLPAAALLAGCAGPHIYTPSDKGAVTVSKPVLVSGDVNPQPLESRPLGMVLKASAFRMNGDYANNVAITLNHDGSVAYYPAPTDISDNSKPLDLGNGWWLNRQGISANSVFTKYTFADYRKLAAAPTPEQLKDAVIPGAHVVEMVRLPYPASEAQSHLNDIKEYLKSL